MTDTLVNTTTAGFQQFPAISSLASGGSVIVWTGNDGNGQNDIYTQRLDAAGNKVGTEIHVNTSTASTVGFQDAAAVLGLPDGGFVVAWESSGGQDGSRYGIFFQRFNAAGSPVGTETQVNTYT